MLATGVTHKTHTREVTSIARGVLAGLWRALGDRPWTILGVGWCSQEATWIGDLATIDQWSMRGILCMFPETGPGHREVMCD